MKKFISAKMINLADPRIGTKIIFKTDDFFAAANRILKIQTPVFKDGLFDKHGKWMDGWETRRKRIEGNDYVTIKLGLPGKINFAEIDTSYFNGNQPEYASIDACYFEKNKFNWVNILSKRKLNPNYLHGFKTQQNNKVFNFIRLNIYPDGGVARLKLLGNLDVSKLKFPNKKFDLLSILNGSKIVACSDEHFGRAENLLLPFKSKNMGNGWETKRRRGSGYDWVIIKLGKPGLIEKFNIETHYFKGNYPSHCSIQGLYSIKNINVSKLINESKNWKFLIKNKNLKPNSSLKINSTKHIKKINYLKLNIYPDGGISRIRAIGKFL